MMHVPCEDTGAPFDICLLPYHTMGQTGGLSLPALSRR